jgi:ketosteroid isomerase-like protein
MLFSGTGVGYFSAGKRRINHHNPPRGNDENQHACTCTHRVHGRTSRSGRGAAESIVPTSQWRNFLSEVKTLDEFTALRSEYTQAFNRNDAAAMTAFYTDDGVAITPDGWFAGHEAIQQWYQFIFRRWQPSDSMWQCERLTGTDSQAWGIGRWWGTVLTEKGPVSASGFWSTEYVRVGNDWKIRSAAYNVAGGIPLRTLSSP